MLRGSGAGRFLDRLRVAVEPGEAQRVERVLAAARAFLAVCSLAAIYLDPTEPARYATLAYSLLIAYALHSFVILILLRVRAEPGPAFRFVVHAADVAWPTVLTLFTEGPNSPFFVIYLFVLLAAAYRWGFRETVGTAAAAVVLLFAEAILITTSPAGRGHFVEGQFEVNRLVMRGTYLAMMGLLLGYLAEQEKLRRAEIAAIARVMAKAQAADQAPAGRKAQGAAAGLRKTLETTLDETLEVFAAGQALVAVQEADGRLFLWTARREPQTNALWLHSSELEPSRRETYFFATPCHSWHVARRSRPSAAESFDLLALDADGRRLRNAAGEVPASFAAAHPFHSLLAVGFQFGEQWSGRLFILDPQIGAVAEAEVRFAQTLVRQVGPAIYNAYLLQHLRTHIGAAERARVARELHDGAIQSLTSVEMQVDVLRRQAEAAVEFSPLAKELERIQQLLRQEVLSLRELMEQLKPVELDPNQLLDFLADLVEKFRRETGVTAVFISELEEVALDAHVCREVARIVQEALVNVRKHSGARNVVVRFASRDATWRLVIDDDGRGFPFAGRFSQEELDAARKGPLVIKERVRSVGGGLAVESTPGRGARLEITIPRSAGLHDR